MDVAIITVMILAQTALAAGLVRGTRDWDGPNFAVLDFVAIVVTVCHSLLAFFIDFVFAVWPSTPPLGGGLDDEGWVQVGYLFLLFGALSIWSAAGFGFWCCRKIGPPEGGGPFSLLRFFGFSLLGLVLFSGSLTPLLLDMWPPPGALVAAGALTTAMTLQLVLQVSTKPL